MVWLKRLLLVVPVWLIAVACTSPAGYYSETAVADFAFLLLNLALLVPIAVSVTSDPSATYWHCAGGICQYW